MNANELAAWYVVAATILNLDETITKTDVGRMRQLKPGAKDEFLMFSSPSFRWV